MKKFFTVLTGIILTLNLYGCVALLAGAAGAGGTAVWLSGKMVQQVNTPYDKVAESAKSTLISMNLPITSQEQVKDLIHIRSRYLDGRKVWVDVTALTPVTTKIEVRIGMWGDKTASEQLLKKITDGMPQSTTSEAQKT